MEAAAYQIVMAEGKWSGEVAIPSLGMFPGTDFDSIPYPGSDEGELPVRRRGSKFGAASRR